MKHTPNEAEKMARVLSVDAWRCDSGWTWNKRNYR